MSESDAGAHVAPKQQSKGNLAMPSTLYDTLKWLVLIVMPAFGTFYFTLGDVWGWPNVEQIVGTILALETFLGVSLQISKTSYDRSDKKYDGDMVVTDVDPSTGERKLSLQADLTPEELADKNSIAFRVVKEDPR